MSKRIFLLTTINFGLLTIMTTTHGATLSIMPLTTLAKMLTFCPNHGKSVCGFNGQSYILFPNECMLEETNREQYLGTRAFEKVSRKLCPDACQKNCTAEGYKPVCAMEHETKRQQTFGNSCEMERATCLTGTVWMQYAVGECFERSTESAQLSLKRVASTKPTVRKAPKTKAKELASRTPTMVPGTQKMITTKKPNLPAKVARSVLAVSKSQTIDDVPQYSIPCAKIFNPVCAHLSGVHSTFINECLVNEENVKTRKNWKIFSQGVCAEDYTSSHHNSIIENELAARGHKRSSFGFNKLKQDLGDDINYIYAPPIFQTEYIDDDGAVMTQNSYAKLAPIPTQNEAYRNLEIMKVQAKKETKKPIRFPSGDIERVEECKYGNVTLCGGWGRNTRTFGNVCELIMRNIFLNQTWTVLHLGACNKCMLNCTKEFKPVCVARNGLNYTMVNECYLNNAICQDKNSVWKIIAGGKCESTDKTKIVDKYESSTLGFRYTSNYGEIKPVPFTWKTTTTTTEKPQEITTRTIENSTPMLTKFIVFKRKRINKIKQNLRPPKIFKEKAVKEIPTTPIVETSTSSTQTKPIYTPATSKEKPTRSSIYRYNPQSQNLRSPKNYKEEAVKEVPTIPIVETTTSSTQTNPVYTLATSEELVSTIGIVETSTLSTQTKPNYTLATSKEKPTRISIYGHNPHSVIMRLLKSKAFT